jgi:hypothetical protein
LILFYIHALTKVKEPFEVAKNYLKSQLEESEKKKDKKDQS